MPSKLSSILLKALAVLAAALLPAVGWSESRPVPAPLTTSSAAEPSRQPQGVPAMPQEFSATALGPYSVRLSWRVGSTTSERSGLRPGARIGFELKECYAEPTGRCIRAALIEADVSQYDYVHGASGEPRRFELRAFNSVGVSAPARVSNQAPADAELVRLRAEWMQRQQLAPQAQAPDVSWRIETAEGQPPLDAGPWQLIEMSDRLPADLRPEHGIGDWWRPIEQSGWSRRCTSRQELLAQTWDRVALRLEFAARVRLSPDLAEVDLFRVAEHDTECDFRRCPGLIAFGQTEAGTCYAHRGWAIPVPVDFEPRLHLGWQRGNPARGQVWCDWRGVVSEFSSCNVSEQALESLMQPLNIDRTGQAQAGCQSRPLADL